MIILAALLISIALVGTAIFVAKKQESNMRPVKVRVKKNKDK